jgi:hypothetical protein
MSFTPYADQWQPSSVRVYVYALIFDNVIQVNRHVFVRLSHCKSKTQENFILMHINRGGMSLESQACTVPCLAFFLYIIYLPQQGFPCCTYFFFKKTEVACNI